MHDRSHDQRGQAVPLVAAMLVLVGVLGAGLVHVAAAEARRASAQAAADAAALAGAADGEDAARAVAEANGAELTSYQEIDLDVVVTVRRGDVRATARGRWTASWADWHDGASGP